jgi:integrase
MCINLTYGSDVLKEICLKTLTPKKTEYKLGDGEGLFIKVTPSGGKHWRFQYQFAGREKSISLGKYPAIGLLVAREERRKAQELIAKGIDPSIRRQTEKRQLAVDYENKLTVVATDWFEMNKTRWSTDHGVKKWRRLEMHLFPTLGDFPIRDIKASDLLQTLKKAQQRSTETAHRITQMCDGIFGYALVMGLISYNPVRDVKKLLAPNIGGNFPVIPISDLHDFLVTFQRLFARRQDKLAFQLLLLTALRTGELRHCKWCNVNWGNAELHIPGEIMKMKGSHIVPLSNQALVTLRELYGITGHQEWLFPSRDARKNPVMSENMINLMIAKMGYKGRIVGHSFRKLFSTVLHEQGFHSSAIERQLSHVDRNKVRGIYNHAQYMELRRLMMQWWADFLDEVILRPDWLYSQRNDVYLQSASQPRALPVYMT